MRWLPGPVHTGGDIYDRPRTRSSVDREGEADGATPDDAATGPTGDDAATAAAGGTGDQEDPDPVELGVQLLARLEHAELPLPEVVDTIETVSTHPATTRAILEEAERRGHINRQDDVVVPAGGRFLSFESEVVTRDGEFNCRRCGASISTGYFMRLEAGEHGPFGSSCIRKVTGRE